MVDKNDPPTPWNSDDVTSRYYQLGTQVWYDPNTGIAGNEIVLNRFGDVDQADFSVSGYVLTAKLVLSSEAPRTTARRLSVEMQTDIFFRKKK